MDERSLPIAQADVLADADQFFTRTSDKGVFALPVRLIKDSAVELDVKINDQTFFIAVQLPVDIADAVRSMDPAAGAELPRTMGIRIADSQIPPANAPGKRFAAETLSLPVQIVQSLAANTPALPFAITSHKNGDVVRSLVRLTGRCDAGFPIRVTGDLVVNLDTLCLSSENQGILDATVKLKDPDGLKSVTVTQTHPSTGEYVSQLLLLNCANPLTAPSLTTANVSGLKPILTGTCDSNATDHTATTTVGSVRTVTCNSGVLSVLVHLPAGSMDFSVTATSTRNGINSSSSAVTFTRTPFICPAGYVGVPGTGVAGLGNASASNGNASWWLDTSKDFCVMKYPAKNNGSNAAVSTTAGAPWVSITRDSSLTICAAVGVNYRLISNTQWQTVARNAESVAVNRSGNALGSGVMARGHSDNSPPNAIENSTDDDPYFGTGNSGAAWNTLGATPPDGAEQKRTHTLTNGEVVWDFAGNGWQWASDNYGDLGLDQAIAAGWDEFSNTTNFPTVAPAVNRLLFAPLGLYNLTQNIGRVYGGSSGAVLRGGDWVNGASIGLFTAFLDQMPTNVSPRIGFRCAYLP